MAIYDYLKKVEKQTRKTKEQLINNEPDQGQ
jgi:polyphosphate kinase